MEIIRITEDTAAQVVSLAAEFRASLRALKGIVSKPDPDEGKKEIAEFLQAGFPVYAAKEGSTCVGYIVCRIEGTVLWSEQIYVAKDHRRKGVASALFAKAEEIAASMGEDTIYNYVHPNNEGMIAFLRSKGYTVLNLIEIRKPYTNEQLKTTIQVDQNTFNY
jgi:ribosomal protein S18 acetylase RimI-like enzyme